MQGLNKAASTRGVVNEQTDDDATGADRPHFRPHISRTPRNQINKQQHGSLENILSHDFAIHETTRCAFSAPFSSSLQMLKQL
jgi:hypothetical protein